MMLSNGPAVLMMLLFGVNQDQPKDNKWWDLCDSAYELHPN